MKTDEEFKKRIQEIRDIGYIRYKDGRDVEKEAKHQREFEQNPIIQSILERLKKLEEGDD